MQGNVRTGCLFLWYPNSEKVKDNKGAIPKPERTEVFFYLHCWKRSRENHILLSLAKIFQKDLLITDTSMQNKATLIQHTEHSQEQWNFISWWDSGNQLNQSQKMCSCYFPRTAIKCLLLMDTHNFLFYCYLLDHFPGHSWSWSSSFFSFCLSFPWQTRSPGNFVFWFPFLLFLLWFRAPEKQMNQQYCLCIFFILLISELVLSGFWHERRWTGKINRKVKRPTLLQS